MFVVGAIAYTVPMDSATAQRMTELTADFYRRVGPSFSATRQAPWQGWERVLDVCALRGAGELTVLDLACGNLRFERYLSTQVERLAAYCVDVILDMAQDVPSWCTLQQLDLTTHPERVQAPECDLCVSFGFMHHLPLFEQRQTLLRSLVEHTRPGGYAVVAFWQFANDPRQLAKARPVPGGGANDYLLGWQGSFEVQRYCHHFPEEEIDDLVAGVASQAREVARFSADGKSQRLNRYCVLARLP